jgi:Lipocalin-like domain
MSFAGVDDLLGAWRLESAVEVFDDGERRDEFGPNPEGYLCYNAAGIMSATLGDSARPEISADDPQDGTDVDYQRMARRFVAYARPFTVDVGNGTVSPRV